MMWRTTGAAVRHLVELLLEVVPRGFARVTVLETHPLGELGVVDLLCCKLCPLREH